MLRTKKMWLSKAKPYALIIHFQKFLAFNHFSLMSDLSKIIIKNFQAIFLRRFIQIHFNTGIV